MSEQPPEYGFRVPAENSPAGCEMYVVPDRGDCHPFAPLPDKVVLQIEIADVVRLALAVEELYMQE